MYKIYFAIGLTLAIIGGGYFLVKEHGKAQYKRGYTQCQADGAMLATEAGEVLKDELQKFRTPNDTDKLLHVHGWMRPEGDI